MTVTIVNTSDAQRRFAVNGAGEWNERKNLEVNGEWVVVVPKEHASKVAVKWKESKAPTSKSTRRSTGSSPTPASPRRRVDL